MNLIEWIPKEIATNNILNKTIFCDEKLFSFNGLLSIGLIENHICLKNSVILHGKADDFFDDFQIHRSNM